MIRLPRGLAVSIALALAAPAAALPAKADAYLQTLPAAEGPGF